MAQLPLWLNVGPRDYLAAGEAGARLGLERAGIEQQANEFAQNVGLKRDELAQQQALEAADMSTRIMGMKVQLAKFLDDRKQQELQNSLVIDEHRRNQDREDQKLAFDKAYKQQLVDWHKSQVEAQQNRADSLAAIAEKRLAMQANQTLPTPEEYTDPKTGERFLRYGKIIRKLSDFSPESQQALITAREQMKKAISDGDQDAIKTAQSSIDVIMGKPAQAAPAAPSTSAPRTILGVNVPSGTGNIKRIVPVPEAGTQPAQVSPPHDESGDTTEQ